MLAIKFVNDETGTHDKGNYRVEVLVTQLDDTGQRELVKIFEGKVNGHIRTKGWAELVRLFSEQLQKIEYEKWLAIMKTLEMEGNSAAR